MRRVHEQKEDAGEQVLVLLTDGANTAGEVHPLKAAELAQQVGLRIYTIGIGAESMDVSSLVGGRRAINPSADLDEATLTEIAQSTGGRYFRATDTASLQDIYALVDELEPVEEPESGFRPVKSLLFLAPGGGDGSCWTALPDGVAATRPDAAQDGGAGTCWLTSTGFDRRGCSLIPVVVAVAVLLAKRRLGAGHWSDVIDPALMPYVLSRTPGRGMDHRWWLLGLAGIVAVVALAGPAWQRIDQPVFRAEQAIVDSAGPVTVDGRPGYRAQPAGTCAAEDPRHARATSKRTDSFARIHGQRIYGHAAD